MDLVGQIYSISELGLTLVYLIVSHYIWAIPN
jgi:hypothetical protein